MSSHPNYKQTIHQVVRQLVPYKGEGSIPDTIPELKTIDPNKLGIGLLTLEGEYYAFGDDEERFSIQSIAKVLSLALAFKHFGEATWMRVGVEPSGNPFNSLVQLEYEKGKPRNPFINAGALVITDMLLSCLENPHRDLLDFVRDVADCPSLDYNPKVAASERAVSFRNAALANMLKSYDNLHNKVEDVLELYIDLCSIEMSCKELAQAFAFFANGGKKLGQNVPILTSSQTKRLNALMQTCGFYDESGEFSYKVGLPGKSGVGGGIIAIHPAKYSVAVWSPRLNPKGNSVLGFKALEYLTTELEMSIF
jgi:glutaminase